MKVTTVSHGLFALLGGVSLLAFSAPAFAESQAPAAAAASGQGVEEVVVNARRRTENLETAPLSVTAFNPQTLENKASSTISDLSGSVPNLLITQQNSGPAATNSAIRGMAFADIEKSFDPTVGVVVDGVFLGTSTGELLDAFDQKSIEVLRGPQGTLFGRNTIGGVINVTRTEPTGEFGGKFDFSFGSYGDRSFRGVVNLPSLGGVLATKLFAYNGVSDGYYTQVATGQHTGGFNNSNFGAAFKFTPGHGFTALLTVEDMRQRYTVVNSNICVSSEVFCGYEPAVEQNQNTPAQLYNYYGSPAKGTYDAPAVTLKMDQKLGGVTLTSVTGFRGSHEAQTQDFDSSTGDFYYTNRIQHFHQFSQELRAAGKIAEPLDYVVGVYYYSSAYLLDQSTNVFGGPVPGQLAEGTDRSYAVFGDFNYKITDRLRLNVGGRWTRDEKGFFNAILSAVSAGGATPPTPGAPVITQVLTTVDQTLNGAPGWEHATFNKFTPKVSLDYRVTSDVMFYASFSQGYRSGGFSNRAETQFSSITDYRPETVNSYEIGQKGVFFDHRLVFNIDGFIAKYNNMQQNTTVSGGPVGNQTIVANVGSSTIKGIEADITARPIPPLTLSATLGLLDSHFHNFITGVGTGTVTDYSANNLIYSPKANASFHIAYKTPVGPGDLALNADLRIISPYDQQISQGPSTSSVTNGVTYVTVLGNDPRVRTQTQDLLDLSASYSFKTDGLKTTLTLFGRNMFDHRGTSAAFTVAGLWSFASAQEPRVLGLKLGVDF